MLVAYIAYLCSGRFFRMQMEKNHLTKEDVLTAVSTGFSTQNPPPIFIVQIIFDMQINV